ncbi:integrase catalytic domain-containing protein, partial [Klebsiella pneumoniae]|uniref:integrase catalytic domain-containing protein n=1 Tax=Klebsiella pneumoniae TaxID=573 RepID=UPI0040556FFB
MNSCETCLKVKYDRRPIKTKYEITPTPNNPFEKIQIDTFYFNKQKFLTIIDSFSKRLLAYPLKNLNQIEIQENLINYFSEYPTPQIIQMDNGKEFDNFGIKNLLDSYKIEGYYISPGGYQDSERANSLLPTMATKTKKSCTCEVHATP